MNEILNFFLEPYQSATVLNISLEFIAALFGVISVFYAKKENILVFPTGIISTVLYVYLLSQWNLYGDLIINIYYTIMSIYGWYMWSKVIDNQQHHIAISRTTKTDKLKAIGIFAFTSVFVIVVYRYYNVMPNNLGFRESVNYAISKLTSGNLINFREGTPYLDTFTTGIFFAAMWLMANKKIENWTLWIAGNMVSIPLYFVKGYGFTGIQYTLFLILAIQGYITWKKHLNKKA
ncbi:MAG: nicotinamide mononucleotide transporter [Lutibacter sp.]|uniref:nicotinamide riboside transporter PnuC n=1 Tax=Lutibacter sp. TaxID=1925666 RepID=UPI00180AC923|nr:nicotinamide riboside transporter PnuC [Lutibacter sp.]MBT8318487.1 nicotinamide riboside transporter PnuC [Lutibacter sp.]NNJ59345.1 nicotinamide mononucleotide transporter [Lutibacter sp.]